MGNKICAISKKEYPENKMILGANIMFAIRDTIQKEHPEFTSESWIENQSYMNTLGNTLKVLSVMS